MATACCNPAAALANGRYRSAEMDHGTVLAALRCEILDDLAVALRDPPVLTVIPGHPFVAQRQGAGAPRVGRIIALHCPRDGPPQLVVLPIGKMRLQEFGDRQI